ncbi:acid phosphatase [Amycolatopsis rubida]|uniref:Acid phosphatase n=1 Tax=Amycolatopsis rubida TaxID=112413 RepID=A0A1I5VEW5_9PSEU|nr:MULTISPECIES: HAD family acid phosphatase [Amycolatopsis]MYW89344.1 acid phosphatase [Amycolatopsis rubida]NEC54322.1 acid phosphatase [Amycolatopsis rubida]OAP21095.1 HAD superfamily, subfamily IIIB (Acid phosphatase) [Amycolatopsis sp. M39]SFQ06088.1 HAD superfamily, subfamily IIIB (Acid phosphatase) [Amycolatopsis rubida]
MRKSSAGRVLAAGVIAGAMTCLAASPAVSASRVPSYQTWLTDVHTAMQGGAAYLDGRIAQGGEKLAVVTDIDNTALETYYRPGEPTADVLSFIKHAKEKGVAVLVASYRSSASDAKEALVDAGYPVDRVCVRKSSEKHATDTKQRCRKDYAAAGYTIIANVGNRPGDFTGGNYEKGFKLPDYNEQLS